MAKLHPMNGSYTTGLETVYATHCTMLHRVLAGVGTSDQSLFAVAQFFLKIQLVDPLLPGQTPDVPENSPIAPRISSKLVPRQHTIGSTSPDLSPPPARPFLLPPSRRPLSACLFKSVDATPPK